MTLPDCLGKPKVRPAQIIFACGDGNFSVQHLKWTGWGESFAAALGDAQLNDCTPNCASGHFHTYRMMLVVTGRQTCPDGGAAYQAVTYAWIGRSPFPGDAPGTVDPIMRFTCAAKR
jgi:hypothetical protein